MRYLFLLLFLLLFFMGCADLGLVAPQTITQTQAGGIGYTGGFASAKAIEKIKKELTPNFKIGNYPQKLCYRKEKLSPATEHLIECVLIPCAVEKTDSIQCMFIETESVFWERERVVESLDTSNIRFVSVLEKCKKNPEVCQDFVAKFKDKTILLEKRK